MSTNRRDFLKLAGAAGAASIAGTETVEAVPVQRISDEWMGMLTDRRPIWKGWNGARSKKYQAAHAAGDGGDRTNSRPGEHRSRSCGA